MQTFATATCSAGESRLDLIHKVYQAETQLALDRAMEKDVTRMKGRGYTLVRRTPKIGRNEPCPCGSGKKFKKCHLQLAA